MVKRGREPLADVPQKDLPPNERNSRLYSFRVNKNSGDQNDVIIRDILDTWLEDGIFTEMIKTGVLLAENREPITNEQLSRWLIGIGKDLVAISEEQAARLREMEAYINQLHQLIRQLTTGQVVNVQQITEDAVEPYPPGFLDTLLNNFDD